MNISKYIQLMNYSWMQSEWKWIVSAGMIGSGLFFLWIGYKVILFKLSWGNTKADHEKGEKEKVWIADEEIAIPLSGRIMPVTQVPDLIFSRKMVGDGFAVEPVEGEILCPITGIVTQIYSNGDAITLKSRGNRNIILHIGINTSCLKGVGIQFDINEGDLVEAGEKIGNIDLDYVMPRVTSVVSPVVFPDLKDDERIVIKKRGMVEAGEKGIVIIEKDKNKKCKIE